MRCWPFGSRRLPEDERELAEAKQKRAAAVKVVVEASEAVDEVYDQITADYLQAEDDRRGKR